VFAAEVLIVERKGGKKNRKLGRNRARCQAYRLAGTREANKVRRIVADARRAGDPLAVPVPDAYRSRVRALLRERPRAALERLSGGPSTPSLSPSSASV
jgi:hypothetical protein